MRGAFESAARRFESSSTLCKPRTDGAIVSLPVSIIATVCHPRESALARLGAHSETQLRATYSSRDASKAREARTADQHVT